MKALNLPCGRRSALRGCAHARASGGRGVAQSARLRNLRKRSAAASLPKEPTISRRFPVTNSPGRSSSRRPSLVGRRAAVFPLLPCRKCEACQVGEYAQCSDYDYYGSRRDGAFAEYIAVKEWNLVFFDDSLSYEEAAMCEPAAVALHAIGQASVGHRRHRRRVRCRPDRHHAGPVGPNRRRVPRHPGATSIRPKSNSRANRDSTP